jgi:hypothetical protein
MQTDADFRCYVEEDNFDNWSKMRESDSESDGNEERVSCPCPELAEGEFPLLCYY